MSCGTISSTGISPPAGSLPAALICCDALNARLYDGTGVSLCILPIIALQLPFCIYSLSCDSLAGKEKNADRNKVFAVCSFLFRIVAQALSWLLLCAWAIGMCLMNGYSVFNVRSCFTSLFDNRQTGGGETSPHLYPKFRAVCEGFFQKNFKNFFLAS